MIFFESFCDQCLRSATCKIVGQTMALGVDEPGYPTEWIAGEAWPRRGAEPPRCTAFAAEGSGASPPAMEHAPRQLALFDPEATLPPDDMGGVL